MATKMATPTKRHSPKRASKPKRAAKPKRPASKEKRWRSRAVKRPVEAGSSVDCARCGERVKFQAKKRHQQVICNVYVKGVWDRVEHYHDRCYAKAGRPYGTAAA